MTRAKASGLVLTEDDAPVVRGMIARGDRAHDVAAWFGVNQGRIAELDEHFPGGKVANPANLPPKGPPGVKGRELRGDLQKLREQLADDASESAKEALAALDNALSKYDANEA